MRKDNEDCFLCKINYYYNDGCTKYHAWHENEGTFFTSFCYEVNLHSVLGYMLYVFDTTAYIKLEENWW